MENLNNTILNKQIWGPHFWMTMYSVAISYPENPDDQLKEQTKNFFNAIQYLLPCDECKQHYGKLLADYPINVSSRQVLCDWIVNINNIINTSLNKSPVQLQYINDYLSGNTNMNNNNIQKSTKNYLQNNINQIKNQQNTSNKATNKPQTTKMMLSRTVTNSKVLKKSCNCSKKK